MLFIFASLKRNCKVCPLRVHLATSGDPGRCKATGNHQASLHVALSSGLPANGPSYSIRFGSNFVQGEIAVLDLTRDIDSLSNFKRNTPEFLRRLKESGHPVVLTVNGKAELVVQDTASYQKLIELAERAERMDALRRSIDDMRAGRVTLADDMLAEMRQILAETQAR